MINLYGSPDGLSPNTLKIRVALIEAGLDFELIPVDLSKGEHKTPEFLAVNPHGKIPALETALGVRIAETNAIMWYVAEVAPKESIGLPMIVAERVRTIQFLDMVSMHIYAPQYQLMLHTTINPPEKRLPEAAEAAKSNIDRALAVIEGTLAGGYGWLAGASYGIADISAAVTLANLRVKVPDETFGPATITWLDRVKARPAWQKAIDTAPKAAT